LGGGTHFMTHLVPIESNYASWAGAKLRRRYRPVHLVVECMKCERVAAGSWRHLSESLASDDQRRLIDSMFWRVPFCGAAAAAFGTDTRTTTMNDNDDDRGL
jgi:hypothetical protein